MDPEQALSCPFCGRAEKNEYQLLFHIEVCHSEDGESPFVVKDEPSAAQASSLRPGSRSSHDEIAGGSTSPEQYEMRYVECPRKCGERVAHSELPFHLDFHLAESIAMEEEGPVIVDREPTQTLSEEPFLAGDLRNPCTTGIPDALRTYDEQGLKNPSTPDRPGLSSWRDLISSSLRPQSSSDRGPGRNGQVSRLSKADLGPYAHEKRMPRWLIDLLEEGSRVRIANRIGPDGKIFRATFVPNETTHLIPVLARLSELDHNVMRAFYCHSAVRHVAKLPKEGGFCGYRNIQMLVSHLHDTDASEWHNFSGAALPSIFMIQDLIEAAWKKGYNSSGRVETGGIRMTRKYIGTAEAEAFFMNVNVACETAAFVKSAENEAYATMLNAICDHFDDEATIRRTEKVVMTTKPPIYFQHRGHSMTIVGIELQSDGLVNLVVFDPMYVQSPNVRQLAQAQHFKFRVHNPTRIMKTYRRGENYLRRYHEFEILKLRPPKYSDSR